MQKKSFEINKLSTLLAQGVKNAVFPGAAAAILLGSGEKREQWLVSEGFCSYRQKESKKVDEKTIYDLASLTKPLVTVLALVALVGAGKIRLDSTLAEILWSKELNNAADKQNITLADLLAHRAGFAAHRPFFKELSAIAGSDRRTALKKLILAEPLIYPVGSRALYSDLGFILAGMIAEQVSGMSLDQLARERLFQPWRLTEELFYPAAGGPSGRRVYAPGEYCQWRQRVLGGEVGDENCAALGGVAGHAGLFGTSKGVATLAGRLLDLWLGKTSHPALDPALVATFLSRQEKPAGTTWALGFDTPTPGASSSGRYFSPTSVGHLGFSGTSFWIDPQKELVVVLLSNRVHPSRYNEKIKKFRPLFHDAVVEALGLVG